MCSVYRDPCGTVEWEKILRQVQSLEVVAYETGVQSHTSLHLKFALEDKKQFECVLIVFILILTQFNLILSNNNNPASDESDFRDVQQISTWMPIISESRPMECWSRISLPVHPPIPSS